MRQSRNGLRPVTIAKYMVDESKWEKGYLHKFVTEGSMDGGIDSYAIVELENGTVTQGDAYRIRFDDVEEPKLEPEEVTFYCKECGADMDAQTDIANEGLCDPCNEGQKEMWAAEQKHEAYEYRDMKL